MTATRATEASQVHFGLEVMDSRSPFGTQEEIADGIARWLLTNQQDDGRILDPLHQEAGSYAAGLAALTFGLKAAETGERRWTEACDKAIRAAELRPAHSEFDQFGLLLLKALESTAGPAAKRSEFPRLFNGRRLVSNNWIALRALNFTLRAPLTGSKSDAKIGESLWRRVLKWQTPSGLFIDSPGGVATPITYHAKFCAMLALALALPTQSTIYNLQSELYNSLKLGLEALAPLISPSGVIAPYGRSRNTIFGQAAAILAFRIGGHLFEAPQYVEFAARLEARLRSFQQADGHIPCVMNEGESEKKDWDVYVNNPDYNAYAAALLLLSRSAISNPLPPISNPGAPQSSRSQLAIGNSDPNSPMLHQVGPLLVIRHAETYAVFIAEGQCAPVGTPFFCDHRYNGMQPLWIEKGGECVQSPEPYTWRGGEDRTALVEPTANCWLPWIENLGTRWCVRVYDPVEATQDGETVRFRAEGAFEAFEPVPRWERALWTLVFKMTGRIPQVFRLRTLRDVRLQRDMTFDPTTQSLKTENRLIGELPASARFHSNSGSGSLR